MTISGEVGGDDPLYLDDLQVGQRFTSKTHVVDAAQIKAFARRSILSPFTSTMTLPRTACSPAWWRAGGTPPRSPCAC
jgi:hypothetical protein